MSLALCRVDDRLVHGQVVIGWGRPLKAGFILLVDDAVRESAWEQDLYRMAMPSGVELRILSLAEALVELPQWAADERVGLLVIGDIATMVAVQAAHPALIRAVNLGGIHHQPARVERLPYLYLTPTEEASLRALAAAGVEVTAQDLPTATPVRLAELVG